MSSFLSKIFDKQSNLVTFDISKFVCNISLYIIIINIFNIIIIINNNNNIIIIIIIISIINITHYKKNINFNRLFYWRLLNPF